LRELAAAHGVRADLTGEPPKASAETPASETQQNMDVSEAKRKWKRRKVVVWLCSAGIVIWTGLGIVDGCVNDYAVSFPATVTGKDCTTSVCTVVYLSYTQPNGESYSDDPFNQVDARRLHTRSDGSQFVTLYWFPNSDEVDTSSPFWDDITGIAVIDVILGGVILAVLIGGRDVRRQAKTPLDPWNQPEKYIYHDVPTKTAEALN
jgi:hypothetical protein